MAVYGCVGLCRAMLGYVGLCKAIERNVFHILANGEPLYDAYTTYLPTLFSLEEIASCREIEKYMKITQRFFPGLQCLGQKVGLISMSTLSLVFSMYEAFAPLIFS